jgi:hypothetical protein
MKLFDIQDGKVVLNPDELSIPAFKKIYESDKTKDKKDAIAKISYIVFMYKWDSPYMSIVDEDNRSSIIKEEVFSNANYKIDKLIEDAIDKFKLFQHTFSLQFLEDNMTGASKLMEYYRLLDWSETDKAGRPVYSSRDLAANLEKAGGILKSLHTLKEQVRKEEVENTRVKGGSEIGSYENVRSLKSLRHD